MMFMNGVFGNGGSSDECNDDDHVVVGVVVDHVGEMMFLLIRREREVFRQLLSR